ncbi:MAG TPA: hypothetical protein VMI52_13945 [Acetobacteraceae bacterium]|nr:hypothetical protein [Acetobacteraceae bacterium]
MSLLGAHLNLTLGVTSAILWSGSVGWYFWSDIKRSWKKRRAARAKEQGRLAVRR